MAARPPGQDKVDRFWHRRFADARIFSGLKCIQLIVFLKKHALSQINAKTQQGHIIGFDFFQRLSFHWITLEK